MRRTLILLVVVAAVTIAIRGLTVAQEDHGTPDTAADLRGAPRASPAASPEASPAIVTDASPETVTEEIIEEIDSGLEEVIRGAPDADDSS